MRIVGAAALGILASWNALAQQATTSAAAESISWMAAVTPYAPHIAVTSLVVALGTLGWRVVEFFVGRRDRTKDFIGGIRDGFWFQEVVFPACIKPIIDATLGINVSLHKLDEEIAIAAAGKTEDQIRQDWLQTFQREHRAQTVRCLMLDVVWAGAYQDAATFLDEIDDLITQHVMCSKLPIVAGDEKTYQVRSKVVQECYGQLKLLLDSLYQRQKLQK